MGLPRVSRIRNLAQNPGWQCKHTTSASACLIVLCCDVFSLVSIGGSDPPPPSLSLPPEDVGRADRIASRSSNRPQLLALPGLIHNAIEASNDSHYGITKADRSV